MTTPSLDEITVDVRNRARPVNWTNRLIRATLERNVHPMTSITLENVGLSFRVKRQVGIPFKEFVLHKILGRHKSDPVMMVRALDGISTQFQEGERIGIVGHNGAGKSTFLKMLAGVYPPTTGRRVVHGHISSLFDLMLGFEPYATGRENIRYRGFLLGETPASIEEKIESIIEFADIGEFIDTPLRNYSSGMKVRLGFAIATAINPEILLIDECFSAGDRAFQEKASERLNNMMGRARLIVLVSHDINLLRRLTTRMLWLEKGQIKCDGPTAEIADAYIDYMQAARNRGAGGVVATKNGRAA